MAKTYPVATVLSSDGRLSGPVLSHRHQAPYWRRRYPTKNLTPKQRAAVLAFRIVDKTWVYLPREWKDEWNAYQRWKKKLGYNHFQRINIPRVYAGLTIIERPSSIP